jgi:hypothetical protein
MITIDIVFYRDGHGSGITTNFPGKKQYWNQPVPNLLEPVLKL